MCIQSAEPGLVAVTVDHLEKRPRSTTRTPRILVGVDDRRRSQSALDDPAWRRESHVGADPVLTIARRDEVERQSLCDPPLDALGRHGHDLNRERIRGRGGEGLAEGVDEGVGTGGAVKVEHLLTEACPISSVAGRSVAGDADYAVGRCGERAPRPTVRRVGCS